MIAIIFLFVIIIFISIYIKYNNKESFSSDKQEYIKYPDTLSLGNTVKAYNIPGSDRNECINNISLEKAKSICSEKNNRECSGFFIYNDKSPSRTCFKSRFNEDGYRKPAPSNLKNSAFYIKDQFYDLRDKNDVMKLDACLNSDYMTSNMDKCCDGGNRLIGARRPLCETLPVLQNKLRVVEREKDRIKNNFYQFADKVEDNVRNLGYGYFSKERDSIIELEDKYNVPDEITGRPAPAPTTPSAPELEDKNQFCGDWARNGECTKNPGYMLPNCAKSCHDITESSSESPDAQLEDKNQFCGDWASSGECTKNPSYMLPNCAKSCHDANMSSSSP